MHDYIFQMEDYLKEKGGLNLPHIDPSSQDTIFEYVVNDAGNWEHWSDRVSQTFNWGNDWGEWLGSEFFIFRLSFNNKHS